MFDPTTASSREIEAHIKGKILDYFGNETEDASSITSSHGSYHLKLKLGTEVIEFDFKKKSVPRILKALRSLKG